MVLKNYRIVLVFAVVPGLDEIGMTMDLAREPVLVSGSNAIATNSGQNLYVIVHSGRSPSSKPLAGYLRSAFRL